MNSQPMTPEQWQKVRVKWARRWLANVYMMKEQRARYEALVREQEEPVQISNG